MIIDWFLEQGKKKLHGDVVDFPNTLHVLMMKNESVAQAEVYAWKKIIFSQGKFCEWDFEIGEFSDPELVVEGGTDVVKKFESMKFASKL